MRVFKSRYLDWLLISLAIGVAYSNIFQNGFVWDDFGFIVNWEATRDIWNNLLPFFQGLLPERHLGLYRPFRSVLYALAFQLWGMNVIVYHAQSIAIQIIASLLVYQISLKIVGKKIIAFTTGLFFGLHPIHVEAITWITANFDIWGVIFALASFYLYLLFKENSQRYSLVFSVLFATLAYFTNEVTLVFAGIIATYEMTLGKKNWSDFIWVSKRSLLYLMPALFFMYIRLVVLQIGGRQEYIYSDIFSSLMVMSVALIKYIRLLLWPVDLTINHIILDGYTAFFFHDLNIRNLPQAPNLEDPVILGSILIILTIIWWSFKQRTKEPLFVFLTGWFLLAALPLMQLVPQPIIFGERYIYFASVGFTIFLSLMLYRLLGYQKRIPQDKAFLIVSLCISFWYGWQTYQRNFVWENGYTLWSSALEITPDSGYIKNGLAEHYFVLEDIDKAVNLLEEAYQENPNNILVRSNLGSLYTYQERYSDSIQLLLQTVQESKRYTPAIEKLALAYFMNGQYLEAVDYYQRYAQIYPNNPLIYAQIGKSYHNAFVFNQAEEAYLTGLELDPNSIDLHNNLGNLYLDWAKPEKALYHFEFVANNIENYPGVLEKINQLKNDQILSK